MRKAWVYDYETLRNFFCSVHVDLKDPRIKKIFIISPWRNDFNEFVTFLQQCSDNKDSLYSYNGLNFDNQISQWFLANKKKYYNAAVGPYSEIYKVAQQTIEAGNFKSGIKYLFPKWNNPFRERDIMSINNYDNPAKRTSLKWIQYGIDWHNLQDMPIHHSTAITQDQEKDVIKYCINDCLSLRKKVLLDKEEILLRDELTNHFKADLLSASEPKISKTIFAQKLASAMNISIKELNSMQTYRKYVDLSEIILPIINFKDPYLQKGLKNFKNTILDGENLKGSFNQTIRYKGIDISYALGGIHGAKRGIHKSTKDYVIKSFDVTSFYPMLAIKNKWAPAHLPSNIFVKTYEGIFNERLKHKKGTALNYVYKIVLNSAYGLSNEKYGNFMKDPQFTMKITVNGQLLLTMLMEDLVKNIPGSRPLMYNTDGGEIIIPRKYEQTYFNICKKWEELTQLSLEHDEYSKLIIADVNTYIGVYTPVEITLEEAKKKQEKALKENNVSPLIKKTKDGRLLFYKTKEKGRYEIVKPLHKNKSYRIIAKMVHNYLVKGKPIMETLNECKNIFDFCAVVRAKGSDKLFYERYCAFEEGLVKETIQKTNRYFISKEGGKITKQTEKTFSRIEAYRGYEQILNNYNKHINFDSYPIDKKYYLSRVTEELQKFTLEHNLFNQ